MSDTVTELLAFEHYIEPFGPQSNLAAHRPYSGATPDNRDHKTTYQRNVPIAMFILSVLLTLATIYSLLTGSWYWAAALPFAFCLTAWWTIVMAKFSP